MPLSLFFAWRTMKKITRMSTKARAKKGINISVLLRERITGTMPSLPFHAPCTPYLVWHGAELADIEAYKEGVGVLLSG